MRHLHLASIPLIFAAAALVTPWLVPAKGAASATKENTEGTVMVSVTPQDLSKNAKTWRFAVRLNTHVSPITQDMLKVTSLSVGAGPGEAPTGWDGDPPGGHHRRGVLAFTPIAPTPETVTLHIRNVGGVSDRAFTWKTSP